MKPATVYISALWLDLALDSQCQGHRDFSTNLPAKSFSPVSAKNMQERSCWSSLVLSAMSSKTTPSVNPLNAGRDLGLYCPQPGGMELTVSAGQQILSYKLLGTDT